MEPEKDDDILRTAREQFDLAVDADRENRQEALDDLRMLVGDQWPSDVRSAREMDNRPCLTINKLPIFLDQVIGDARQNKPSIKVKPVDSGSDPALSKVLEGLIRNIERVSGADATYDTALEQSAACGWGCFRITNDYCDDDAFEQELRIKRIRNPFTVYFDPDCNEPDCSDARFVFVTETISREQFKQLYPGKAEASELPEGEGEMYQGWYEPEKVRIAEWWRREPVERVLVQFASADKSLTQVFDAKKLTPEILAELEARGLAEVNRRTVKTHKITWRKITATEVLDGPHDWPGKYIPIIPVVGKEINLEGKTYRRGLIRFAKDPQRMYNYWRTTETETIALAPKSPWVATEEQIEGRESIWSTANVKNHSILTYKPDPLAPPPQRQPMPQIPAGALQGALNATDDIKSTTGIFDASLGSRSNETSGKAILARQREGDVATFAFIDNLARAIRHAGRVLVDLVPRIYDTDRIIRTLGPDGAEEMVRINYVSTSRDPQTGMPVEVIANDLSAGRYDVDVVVGPSYSTQRQEAAESLIQFVQAVPQAGAAAADLIAKNMDWPGAEELADRLRKMLPPGIAEPKEGEQPAPPPPPNPLEQLKAQEMAAKNAKTAEEVKGLQLDNDAKALELSMQNGQLHEAIAQAVTQSLAQLFGQPGQPAGPAAPINPITPAPAGMPGQTA